MSDNVAVGFISDEKVDAEFVSSLLSLLAQRADSLKGRVIHVQGQAGRLDIGRHMVAKSFLEKTDADYLLMIDTDTVFTVKDYDELARSVRDSEDPVVVSGLYARIDGSFCVFDLGDGEYHSTPVARLAGPSKFYAADAVGLGFTIVPRPVFEAVLDAGYRDYILPWFQNHTDPDSGISFADDTSFCYRVRAAGVPVYVNTTVAVGHLKKVTMYPKIDKVPELIVPELIVP